MKNEESLSAWKAQLEAAAVALGEGTDTPDWLKQVVLHAIAVAAEIQPDVENEQAQDSSFLYPH